MAVKITRIKRLKKKLLISALHSLFLVVLTIWLQYTSNVRVDEIAFFKFFAIAKHNILGIDRKPAGDSIVFLDVSKDIKAIPDSALNWGNVVITDRTILAEFFKELNKHKSHYKAVICDIAFNYPSPDDSILRPLIEKADRTIIALSLNQGHPQQPLFKGIYGATDYTVNGGNFVKYPVFYNDTIESLPAKMFQKIDNVQFAHERGLSYLHNQLIFNTVIPDFYYRNYDLIEANSGYQNEKKPNLFHLGEVVSAPDFFNAYLKDKYILIGDFYNDRHNTYLGGLPGTLILFDTYLTLKENDLSISIAWVTLLFFVFFLVSFNSFFLGKVDTNRIKAKIKISFIRKFLVKYLSYIGVLILLNILSYAFFGVFISLLYVATYLTTLEMVIEKVAIFRRTKSLAATLED